MTVAYLKPRAAFEMHCPADQLQFSVLATMVGRSDEPAQIGVSGCSQQVVYLQTTTAGWVMNSARN